MSWSEDDVILVPVAWLKPHEEIKERNRDKLLEMTKRWGWLHQTAPCRQKDGTILDGHHRHSIACLLGLKRVPALCVDYLADEGIHLSVWPIAGVIR